MFKLLAAGLGKSRQVQANGREPAILIFRQLAAGPVKSRQLGGNKQS